MWSFIDFIERHKFGIMAALASFIGLFMYVELQTYRGTYEIMQWDKETNLAQKEIEIKPENIEEDPAMASGDIKSIAKNVNDSRQSSNENWDRNKSSSQSTEQRIQDLEKQYYAETGEGAKQAAIKKQIEDIRKQQKEEAKTDNRTKGEQNTSGGNTAFKGRTMVSWDLRDPFQGNEWWVRNPGYTCGYGQSGEVYIKIKVNQNGNVTSATYLPEKSSGATSCMIEQAKKYASMSRFVFSTSASQEGWILYKFIAQ